MGFILGGQATGPGTSYFITQGPTNGDSDNKSIALDSLGNIYSVGSLSNTTADISLIKYDSTGAVVWQYKIDSTSADAVSGIHIDSSDNIFVVGTSGSYMWVAKFNTSGAIQWQRQIKASSGSNTTGNNIVSDSSGNLYVVGWFVNLTGCLIKLDSSGVVQWFKYSDSMNMAHLVIDSSNNLYLMGQSNGYRNPTAGGPGVIVKLNSSGNQVWLKTWDGGASPYTNYAGGLALSSSGSYLYASFSGGNSDAFLAKLSTTDGSQAWQQKVADVGNEYGGSVAVDSSENIYWATSQLYNYDNNVGFNNQKAVIFKYNSSGTLQWQRQMYVSGKSYPNAFDYLNKIVVLGSDFYVAGHMNLTNIFARLPVDGTQTSATSYSVNGKSIVYNASSLSQGSTGTITLGSSSSTQFTTLTGYVESATSLTPSTTSYTISNTVTGTGAGVPITSGIAMSGTGTGMVISSYVPPPNWLDMITGSFSNNSNQNYGVATNGSDIYVVGDYNFMGSTNYPGRGISIYKYNSAGVLQWAKREYTNNYYNDAYSAEVDASGNLYVAGCLFWGWGGYSTISTIKYNSSGTKLWQQALKVEDGNYSTSGGASGGQGLIGRDLVLDSSGNVYTTGRNISSMSEIVKYNSSGTIQWQKSISFANATTIAKDSSDNLYVGSQYAGYFVKCDSSGTVLFSRSVSSGGQNLYITSMNCDSSDNVYVHGYINDTTTSMNKQVVMKYNSSGSVVWQRKIGYAWVGASGYTNAAGDTYLVGTSNNASSTAGVKSATVVKYNSSGTLQFQRYIKSNVSGATITPTEIKEYGSDKIVIVGYTDATSAGGYTKQLTIVLPSDGTGTKTYTAAGYSWTYATCTDAEAAITLTSSAGSITTSTTSYSYPINFDYALVTDTLTVTSNTTTLT
jgi:hypothetical protein